MQQYIMALDQGTTSSRCVLYDRGGNICGMAQKELPQIYPQPGWVEQRPQEIWSTQFSVMTEVLAETGITPAQIAGIGVTNQRETTIVWDRETGAPIYNAIVWQCRRTAERIAKLKETPINDVIRQRTGLLPDAYFSASKIAWILDHVEGAREKADAGELMFGTVDSWVIYNLTGREVHVTDYTNASRTMLFDIRNRKWDEEILDYFRIPKSMLPEVKNSSCIYGYTKLPIFDRNIPVCGAAGDQQAALFGQCCFESGKGKVTYGTGCFLLMHTGEEMVLSQNGLLTTLAASVDDKPNYALEGSVFVAGASIQWLRDEMHLIWNAPQSEEMAAAVPDTDGVYVVPAFAGLGAPYWDSNARGTIVGITRGTNNNHVIRATLESIAYQAYDLISVMEKDSGSDFSEIRVDGGACANNLLMQFQSDITDRRVVRPVNVETTSLGAAYLAGLAVGYWKDLDELQSHSRNGAQFEPQMCDEQRNKLLKGWKRAVRAALAWAGDEE